MFLEIKALLYGLRYARFMNRVTRILEMSDTSDQIDEATSILWSLAEDGDMHALGMYGLAYLMDGKEWYDSKKGLAALRRAAESGEPFSQHQLGVVFYYGKKDIEVDMILAKYWISQSAESDFEPAISDLDVFTEQEKESTL